MATVLLWKAKASPDLTEMHDAIIVWSVPAAAAALPGARAAGMARASCAWTNALLSGCAHRSSHAEACCKAAVSGIEESWCMQGSSSCCAWRACC